MQGKENGGKNEALSKVQNDIQQLKLLVKVFISTHTLCCWSGSL